MSLLKWAGGELLVTSATLDPVLHLTATGASGKSWDVLSHQTSGEFRVRDATNSVDKVQVAAGASGRIALNAAGGAVLVGVDPFPSGTHLLRVGGGAYLKSCAIGSSGGYGTVSVQTDTAPAGYNGHTVVESLATPGSGVATHQTHFRTAVAGAGSTRHDVKVDGGFAAWGISPPNSRPVISGTLTGATLAQLTSVVSQLVTAIDATGLVQNTTT